MKSRLLILFLLNILVASAKFCDEKVRLELKGDVEVLIHNGSIIHNNVEYPEGTHWKDGSDYYGCPCEIKECLRFCSKNFTEKNNFTVPTEDFLLQVWHDDEQLKSVKVHDHFIPIKESKCSNGYPLEPDKYETDEFNILANGSIHFLINMEEDGEANRVTEASEYCIVNNDSAILVFICMSDEEVEQNQAKPEGMELYLYAFFMIISILFLLLVLVAFFTSPEMQNLHGKSIACQSGTLMIAFIALTVVYLAGADSSIVACKIFAYLAFIFMLSSFYWLNTMCFDIFWTFSDFKKMTGSLQKTHKKKFRMYAVYSTINPLLLSISFMVMDNVLDEKSSLWPGIGEKKCWFRNRKSEFMFFQGPILLLLIANIIFFTMTIYKFLKMKKETAVLKRSDSSRGGMDDKQRFALYIKLFLLMGGTWLLEILSWSVGGPAWIWFFTDLINCLRGVLIFYFCVWSNKKVRNSLLSRVSSTYARKYVVDDKHKSSSSNKTYGVSDVSAVSHNDTELEVLKTRNDHKNETAV